MTTNGLNQDGINALRAAVRSTGDDVRSRARQVTAEADRIDEDQARDARDAAIAARLLQQQHEDRRRVVNEEASQLARILGAPEPAPVQPAATPRAPWEENEDDDDVVPGLTPAAPQPPVAPEPRVQLNPNAWCRWALWAAIIAALFATLGLWLSCDFVVVHGLGLAKAIVANVLIDGGIVSLSFFAVGLIANEICRKLRRRRQH